MKLQRFERINQICQDLEATRKFYQLIFPDWHVRAEGEGEGWRWMHFGNEQFYLSLSQPPNPGERSTTGHLDHVGFVIDDGNALMQLLKANGIEHFNIDDSPETKFRIYVSDPDGTAIEFVEYNEAYALK
jgi:catechol 2,3-dioxygenase-like lactoylglutathione lyase family enzyme